MKTKKIHNVQLGLFVLAGLAFLIFTLYMMSRNRNLLGSTFMIKAVVSNVNGLVPGNNVRFKGIDVGTVKSIEIASDTTIYVNLVIDSKLRTFIKQNAIVSIGSDGLMGNKLININSKPGFSEPVKDGSILISVKPIETDEMLRTLNTTNNNIERITDNLKQISIKLNNSNSLWNLLSDTVITHDLKKTINSFREAGTNTARLTGNAQALVARLDRGQGMIPALFTDTTMVYQVTTSLATINYAADETAGMMEDLNNVVENMKRGDGTAGMLLTDTLLRNSLYKSIANVEEGTSRFNENMEAMRANFLFRKHFKKLEKEKKKETKSSASTVDNKKQPL
jgi:phospholipid/cholesterol/gamma-HCH transport system substrate-binding protein